MGGHRAEHLGHHPITARMTQQLVLQQSQRLGHGLERRAITQRPRLALDQGNVVGPVVDRLVTIEAALQRHAMALGAHHQQPVVVRPQAHHRMHPFARYAVAVALEVDQRGGRHPHRVLHIAIEGTRVRRQAQPLVLPHLGHRELVPLGVAQLAPGVHARLLQPGVELAQAGPASLAGFTPDATPAVLHVLLHDALLPARCAVAELGIKEVVTGHRLEAGVDAALLARADLVHCRLHVVVDTPLGHPAQHRKGPGMGLKQHLVRLAVERRQHKRPAGRQLGVRHLQAPAQSANERVLGAPVKLERLAQFKGQGHKACPSGTVVLRHAPLLGKAVHRSTAAAVAHGAQGLKHRLDATALSLVAVLVGLEPAGQGVLIRRQYALRLHPHGVLRLPHFGLRQPLAGRVARDPQPPAGLPHRYAIPQHEAAQFTQCAHVDHS